MSEKHFWNACGEQVRKGCGSERVDDYYGVEYEHRCDGCARNPETDMSWCVCPTCEHFDSFMPSTHRLKGSRRVEHKVYCVGLVDYVPNGSRSEKVTYWRFSPAARRGKYPNGFDYVTCDDYKRVKGPVGTRKDGCDEHASNQDRQVRSVRC